MGALAVRYVSLQLLFGHLALRKEMARIWCCWHWSLSIVVDGAAPLTASTSVSASPAVLIEESRSAFRMSEDFLHIMKRGLLKNGCLFWFPFVFVCFLHQASLPIAAIRVK